MFLDVRAASSLSKFESAPNTVRIMLIGDKGVGKSSLLNCYKHSNAAQEHTVSTRPTRSFHSIHSHPTHHPPHRHTNHTNHDNSKQMQGEYEHEHEHEDEEASNQKHDGKTSGEKGGTDWTVAPSTPPIRCVTKTLLLDSKYFQIQIWNMPCPRPWSSSSSLSQLLPPSYLSSMDGFIYVYDVTSTESFALITGMTGVALPTSATSAAAVAASTRSLLSSTTVSQAITTSTTSSNSSTSSSTSSSVTEATTIRQWVKRWAKPNVAHLLVGTKLDDEVHRVVSREDGRQFADRHGLRFFETSSKSSTNVVRMFTTFIIDIITRVRTQQQQQEHEQEQSRESEHEDEHKKKHQSLKSTRKQLSVATSTTTFSSAASHQPDSTSNFNSIHTLPSNSTTHPPLYRANSLISTQPSTDASASSSSTSASSLSPLLSNASSTSLRSEDSSVEPPSESYELLSCSPLSLHPCRSYSSLSTHHANPTHHHPTSTRRPKRAVSVDDVPVTGSTLTSAQCCIF